jgi:hypothetical protein
MGILGGCRNRQALPSGAPGVLQPEDAQEQCHDALMLLNDHILKSLFGGYATVNLEFSGNDRGVVFLRSGRLLAVILSSFVKEQGLTPRSWARCT